MASRLVLQECEGEAFLVGSMFILVNIFFSFPNMEGGYARLELHI